MTGDRNNSPFATPIETALDAAGLACPGYTVADAAAELPACFDVTGLAVAAIGTAAAELRALCRPGTSAADMVVDRRLASLWFAQSIRPQGWQLPPVWDDIAGLYQTRDGWIRLHTNAASHRAAALAVLGCAPSADAVAVSVADWTGQALEAAITEAGGCSAEMRSAAAWQSHPQGAAVGAEPLISWSRAVATQSAPLQPAPALSDGLQGLRVLDLTRILAGPVCTRFLAAFGAEVLRIDPPGWAEPNVVAEVTPGKRCATLDLNDSSDRRTFENLVSQADLLVHGLRPGALAGLGYTPAALHSLNPELIDVSLCAYGWTGPWHGRRGYDSLVQMSVGITEAGMRAAGADQPTPLPVQALDHATGYLMAAAALRALRIRRAGGDTLTARLSLARTAALLMPSKRSRMSGAWPAETPEDLDTLIEHTDWGPARRLKFPVSVAGLHPQRSIPGHELHKDPAVWSAAPPS